MRMRSHLHAGIPSKTGNSIRVSDTARIMQD